MKIETKTKIFQKAPLMLVLAVPFFFGEFVFADNLGTGSAICENEISINEIFPFKTEFVELINRGNTDCDLVGWSLTDNIGFDNEDENLKNKSWTYHRNILNAGSIIKAGGYFVIEGDLFLNDGDDSVKLFNPNKNKTQEIRYEKAIASKSYSLNNGKWNWQDPSPQGENVFNAPSEENAGDNQNKVEKNCSVIIKLNEILPNPSGEESENEFIELSSQSDIPESLAGWRLYDKAEKAKQDKDSNGKFGYGLDQWDIEKYLVVYRRDFKFALYGDEGVYLRNPCGEYVSSVSFSGGAEDISYGFDGKDWRWSSHLTPGKENVFDEKKDFEIKIDKKIYKGIGADFEVISSDDGLKVTWDFGDGKKSYKLKITHKYEKTGKFKGNVKISGDAEDFKKDFEVEVKKFPNPKVSILEINPNPFGIDSEAESITIKNKSKKEINLKGWSIASGSSSKKLSNHPITEDLIVKAGKILEITREFSKFSLGNKKAKIELRYPNGEVAYDVKYKNDKAVAEGMVYEKKKEGGWGWRKDVQSVQIVQDVEYVESGENFDIAQGVQSEESERFEQLEQFEQMPGEFGFGEEEDALEVISLLIDEFERDLDEIYAVKDESVEIVEKVQVREINTQDIGKFSKKDNEDIFKLIEKNNPTLAIEVGKDSPKVLGVQTLRVENGEYRFTEIIQEEDHYAVSFAMDFLSDANMLINNLLNSLR